jgi:hypothetical protein
VTAFLRDQECWASLLAKIEARKEGKTAIAPQSSPTNP